MRKLVALAACIALGAALVTSSLASTRTLAHGRAAEAAGGRAARAGVVTLHDRTWHCRRPQHGTVVHVTIVDGSLTDGVHLDRGCTGRLTVYVVTNAADGVTVHGGAHDLVVTGRVTCLGHAGRVHQDGVQALGGTRVQFGDGRRMGSFTVVCPTGNNGGLWINSGNRHHSLPTDVTCDHCDLFEGNVALHIGTDSLRSGARNSILRRGIGGASPRIGCARVDPGARDPLDLHNVCAPAPKGFS